MTFESLHILQDLIGKATVEEQNETTFSSSCPPFIGKGDVLSGTR